jgi:Family of unknown function (DUF6491)
MKRAVTLSVVLLSLVVCAAAADSPTATQAGAPEAQIRFANHGGIYNWQVVDDRTVLIQGQNRKWYKATLFSACIGILGRNCAAGEQAQSQED